MSIESLIARSGQSATIAAEAPPGQLPAQTAMGGADRSDAQWIPIAAGIPCLVCPRSSQLQAFPGRNDARANTVDARIYLASDPVPGGLSTRHRLTVTLAGTGEPTILGVYAVQGVIDPNSMGRILQVDCERIRTP